MFSSLVPTLLILVVFLIDNSFEQYCSVFLDNIHQCQHTEFSNNVQVYTVASEENDGYKRFINSAKYYKIQVKTLGLGEKWQDDDIMNIMYLRKELKPFQNDNNTIIIFTHSSNVVFTSKIGPIINKFKNVGGGAKILFSASVFCLINQKLNSSLTIKYTAQAPCLNAGIFIGYATTIYQLLLQQPLANYTSAQDYYNGIYLNDSLRFQYGVKLDTKSEIFQTLNGATSDVKLNLNGNGDGELINLNFLTTPNILQGNGKSKIIFNSIANYLAGSYQHHHFYNEEEIILNATNLPVVTLAIFIEKTVPFFQEFLEKIAAFNYPKKYIDLFIYSNIPYHEETLKIFIQQSLQEYNSIFSIDDIEERDARKLIIQYCQKKNGEFLLVIDNDAHIDDPNMLKELIAYNKSVIAPLLVKPKSLESNFWGALTNRNYYKQSHDYAKIVKGKLKGIWNVPFISSCYLMKRHVLKKIKLHNQYIDSDMSLCEELRTADVFMYIVNMKEYGHLINYDDFNTSVIRPEFYTLLTNPSDWEKKYIRPEYYTQLIPGYQYTQPCPDVYWFPIVTEQFCDDLVAIAEDYGIWTGGTYANGDKTDSDPVPTSDIYMYQVGLQELWLDFLKRFVRPLSETVYVGYYQNPPRSRVNFVVRYKPDEQSFLRPHHDTSTYTINIALNRAMIDYEGGGCKFVRYNCSVTDTKKGWMLMHPGQLTHLHEGLRVTNGTRYIMVSFIDPNN